VRPQDVERTGDNPDCEIPDILERKTGSNQRLSHWYGGFRPSGSRHLRHPVIRFPPRLVIGIVSAVALVAVAASIGSVVWPASKAQAGGATTGTVSHPLSASSSMLGSFGWLASTTPPASWARLTVPSGVGTLSSPPGFRTVEGDPGTLSVALRSRAGTYLGYLNVTPHQGDETLRDWAAFRLSHLLDDDAISVHEDAKATALRTASGARSCVIDDYVTTTDHHHFHEVSCYVVSGSQSSVVVAATPSGDPAHVWTELERAVAAYPL
jgi:hypothetical protein